MPRNFKKTVMYADIAAQSRSLLVSAAHCQCRDLRPLLLSFANKEYRVRSDLQLCCNNKI